MIEYVSIVLLALSLVALVVGAIGIKLILQNKEGIENSNEDNINI